MKNAIAVVSLLATLMSTVHAHAAIRENGGFLVPAAAVLNFVSIGAGVDTELKNQIDTLIQTYKEAGLVQQHTIESRGIEGEIQMCVRLNEYDASKALNTQLETLIQNRPQPLTQLSFTSSCPQ